MPQKNPLTQRKEPKQDRSHATLDAILQAAAQILAQAEQTQAAGEGMGTSTHAIAKRAGVSVGSLYQYFPSKSSLIQALIRHHLKKQVQLVRDLIATVQGLPAEEAAARLVRGLIGQKTALFAYERAMMRYFCQVGDLGHLTQLDHEMVAAVQAFFDGLGPQIRPVDTELAAFIVTHALRSAILLAILQYPDRLHDPAFERELTALVVRYLRPTA